MMESAIKHQTPNSYEQRFGYSRAVRKAQNIFVSETTSIDPSTGDVLHPTSAFQQTKIIFAKIVGAVEALGGKRTDIVRVRMFVTHSNNTEDVGKGLKECLGDVCPAATMIIGAKFVRDDMRVEIEADALIS